MLKSANAVDLRVEQATAKEMSAIGTKRTWASMLWSGGVPAPSPIQSARLSRYDAASKAWG